jgi:CBS domain-containing protein
MLVKEIMTKNVITIDKEQTVLEAANLYKKHRVGCLIVTKEEECIGIITERDLIERTICKNRLPEQTKVKDIMSKDIISINYLEKIDKASKLMINNNIKKLPVTKNEEIVGIITVTDISRSRPDLSKRFMDSWVKPIWKD